MRAEVEQALAALQNKERGGMDRALLLLQRVVFAFSMKVCGQHEDAEDTMQETLLRTVSRLTSFRDPKALGVWLYKVAKSQCLMSRRKSKFAPREQLSLEMLLPNAPEPQGRNIPELAGPAGAVLRKERAEQLQEAILKLPPAFRLIVVLHDMEELSIEEVAQITGLREGTVRVRLHRARVFLRNSLSGAAPRRLAARKKRCAANARCRKLFRELSDYLDGELDPSLCEELEEHLSDCQPCRAFVKSLEQTVRHLRRHHPPALDPRSATRIRRKLLAEYNRALQQSRGSHREPARSRNWTPVQRRVLTPVD